jgi:hypothetical protein
MAKDEKTMSQSSAESLFDNGPITLNYDGADAPLVFSKGTLTLTNKNVFTVNGSVLGAGTYTLIQAANAITSSGTYTVTGTAIPTATGFTASVAVSGNVVQLTITGTTTYPSVGTNLVFSVSGGSLKFSWSSSYLGSALQSNSIAINVTNDWFTIAGSTTVTNMTFPIGTNGSVFFRLNTP